LPEPSSGSIFHLTPAIFPDTKIRYYAEFTKNAGRRNGKALQVRRHTMQTNNHKIEDYDAVLDAKFGKSGTPLRVEAEFYASKIVKNSRKQANVAPVELC
jgi:hypothetical protein